MPREPETMEIDVTSQDQIKYHMKKHQSHPSQTPHILEGNFGHRQLSKHTPGEIQSDIDAGIVLRGPVTFRIKKPLKIRPPKIVYTSEVSDNQPVFLPDDTNKISLITPQLQVIFKKPKETPKVKYKKTKRILAESKPLETIEETPACFIFAEETMDTMEEDFPSLPSTS